MRLYNLEGPLSLHLILFLSLFHPSVMILRVLFSWLVVGMLGPSIGWRWSFVYGLGGGGFEMVIHVSFFFWGGGGGVHTSMKCKSTSDSEVHNLL